MCFRFMGGGGTPFPVQNVLPVISLICLLKNYIAATLLRNNSNYICHSSAWKWYRKYY